MNVLSLFDGISCGQIALERAGIKVKNYYASEIDKYAIAVTQHNYPDTIQLDAITKINIKRLPKMGLLIGGSPCQGFSFAGKQLNFNDPRSILFFEYVKILDGLKKKNPDIIFILENVFMKKEYQDIISDYLEVPSIKINSSLISAQTRKRLYWTNIDGIKQPKDKKIFLKDILINSENNMGRIVGRRMHPETNKRDDYNNKLKHTQILEMRGNNKSGTLTTVQKDNIVIRKKSKCIRTSGRCSYDRHEWDSIDNDHFRKLTPIECERLQTVPDNYTNYVSNSQRYKALGNCFTVDVIVHILKSIKNGLKPQITQGFFTKEQIIKYRKVIK